MELIYVWVEEFRNIKQKGFSFSDRFKVDYNKDTRELKIKKNEDYFDYFKFADPDSRVTNVSAVVGVNGSGKSNLLELLGKKRNDGNLEAKYFALFHSNKMNFVLEGNSNDVDGYTDYISNISKSSNSYPARPDFSLYTTYRNGSNEINSYTKAQSTPGTVVLYRSTKNVYGSVNNSYEQTYMIPRFNINNYEITNKLNELDYWAHVDGKRFESLFLKIDKIHYDIEAKDNVNSELQFWSPKFLFEPSENHKENFIYEAINTFIESVIVSTDKSANGEQSSNFRKKYNSVNNDNSIKELYSIALKACQKFKVDTVDFANSIIEFLEVCNKLPEEAFTKDGVLLNISENTNKCREVISVYDKWNTALVEGIYSSRNFFNNSVTLSIVPYSDGEKAFIDLFTQIYCGVKEVKPGSSIVLLLDEADSLLHPEWNRALISKLIFELDRIENPLLNFQLILTSHMPFTLSDLPSGNVIRLDKDLKTGECIYANENKAERYLAANIHELLSDKFFMERTIGEYAYQTLNKVLEVLNNPDSEEFAEWGKMDTLTGKTRFDLAYQFAEQIAEPLISNKLKDMIAPHISSDEKETLKLQKELLIKQLEKEIGALEA